MQKRLSIILNETRFDTQTRGSSVRKINVMKKTFARKGL